MKQDEIGPFGMRIDREMYRDRFAHQAQDAVAGDAALREAFEAEDWPAMEARIRQLLFGKPEDFWDLPRLQQIYKTDRVPGLREILARVFGLMPAIATRDDMAGEAFERYLATQETNATHSRELRTVFVAFLLDPQCRLLLEEGKFPDLRTKDPGLYGALQHLAVEEREMLMGYLRAHVRLGEFEIAA